ncbi:MAG: hypothetical protein ACHQAY_27930 [Hyphomicrobiales bacterium]
MKRAAILALCIALWGCGSSSDERQLGLDVRPLSDGEKQALGRSLSQTLAEPGSAQFKWMPVLVTHTEESKWIPTFATSTPKFPPVGYCGLVSEKGGAFRVFAATIAQGSGGQYDHGKIEGVDSAPAIPAGSRATKPAATHGAVEERCGKLGYSEFSLAS